LSLITISSPCEPKGSPAISSLLFLSRVFIPSSV
jgi:hypothetical protein